MLASTQILSRYCVILLHLLTLNDHDNTIVSMSTQIQTFKGISTNKHSEVPSCR